MRCAPALLGAAAMALSGCNGWFSTSTGNDAGPSVAFSEVQAQVLAGSCTFAGCHASSNPAASLALDGPAACARLVSSPSCLFPSKLLVAPGAPDKSFLVDKLQGTNLTGTPAASCAITNQRMPLGGAPLSQDQVNLVVNWISAGATCDAVSDGGSGTASDGGGADAGVVDGPDSAAQSLSLPPGPLLAGAEVSMQLTLVSVSPPQGQMVMVQTSDITALAAPTYVFVPGGQSSVSFPVMGKRPASVIVTATAGGATVPINVNVTGLYLAEILFAPQASPVDGQQWIKIYNGGTVPIDLGGYSLGAGLAAYTETLAQLSGVIAPGSCALIGGPESNAGNGGPKYSQNFAFSPDLPTSSIDGSAFGFALFDAPEGSLASDTSPLDAVQVGATVNPIFPGLPPPLAPAVSAGTSIARGSLTQWNANQPSTPNTCSFQM